MTYREAVQTSRAFIERYTQMLCSLGYQDIDIKVPISSNRATNQTDTYILELRELNSHFWCEEYGYELKIQLCKGYYAPENIVELFNEVAEFIGDPTVLSTVNIGNEFFDHIKNKGFVDVNKGYFTNEKVANLIAFKDGIKYSFCLHRRWPDERTSSNDEDDPIEFTSDEINSYTQKIKELFIKKSRTNTYKIELSSDLTKLSAIVHQNWDEHYLTINLCNSDMTWEEDVFCGIVDYWIESTYSQSRFLENLKDALFHLRLISRDEGIFEAYKEGCKYEIRVHSKRIIDFDHMEGHIFEHFCAEILSYNGFNQVRVTQGSRDQGIDIIAYKDDIQYGIQCKCYTADIGNKAVQEVYAGKTYYNCDVAVVLTNRYFTQSAIELAKKNRVHLWDRRKLLEFVENCKERLLGTYENKT